MTNSEWQARNDSVNAEKAPIEIAEGASMVRLAPDRPLIIRHSPTFRAREGARLFAGVLHGLPQVSILQEEALDEPEISFSRIISREEYDARDPRSSATLFRILAAMLDSRTDLVRITRAELAGRYAALRHIVASSGPENHLWISHGPVMPFLHLGFVDGIEPEGWTYERVIQVPRFQTARGFSVEVPVP